MIGKQQDVASNLELEPLHIESEEHTDGLTVQRRTYDSYGWSKKDSDVIREDHTDTTPVIAEAPSVGGYSIPQWLNDRLFPPHLPRDVQLLRLENIAIPACYLLVGTMQGMFRPLLNVYPLFLHATEAQQTTLSNIATLPAAFKIIYGFISDNLPLVGYRRKPYMLIGWLVASLVMLSLTLTSNLHIPGDVSEVSDTETPEDAPSIQQLSISFFIFGLGMWFADVMADSLVVQKVSWEPEDQKGSLQSTCYACRFFGLMVSAPISTYLYSNAGGPYHIVSCLIVGPLLLMPLIYALDEARNVPIKSTRDQCHEIWETVCSRSVWQPMGFIYVFNLLQVSNAAWRQFLKTVLGFTAQELNILLVVSYVLLYLGTITYKYCFLHSSWRRVYQSCILLNAFFSGLQLLLVRGKLPFGLSPFMFALGDEVFAEFIGGIQFLPTTIMMVALCRDGVEGASYAMFTTVWNSAMMLAPAIRYVGLVSSTLATFNL